MLSRLLRLSTGRSVPLALDDEAPLRFTSSREFAFACDGRTAMPTARLRAWLQADAEQIDNELRQLGAIEKRFIDVLCQGAASPPQLHRALCSMPAEWFSLDHGWRTLLGAVRQLDPAVAEQGKCVRLAMSGYLKYLQARLEALRSLQQRPAAARSSAAAARSARLPSEVVEDRTHYERLPKNEAFLLELAEGDDLGLVLSRHECSLSMDGKLAFSDRVGEPVVLSPGRTSVGRDRVNDIIIDAGWRDVSRLHLVIDYQGGGRLRLTDMSSHGTYLARGRAGGNAG